MIFTRYNELCAAITQNLDLYSGSSEASVSGEVGEDSLAVWGLGGQFDRQESFIRSLFPETFDMTDIQCRTLYKLCQLSCSLNNIS